MANHKIMLRLAVTIHRSYSLLNDYIIAYAVIYLSFHNMKQSLKVKHIIKRYLFHLAKINVVLAGDIAARFY